MELPLPGTPQLQEPDPNTNPDPDPDSNPDPNTNPDSFSKARARRNYISHISYLAYLISRISHILAYLPGKGTPQLYRMRSFTSLEGRNPWATPLYNPWATPLYSPWTNPNRKHRLIIITYNDPVIRSRLRYNDPVDYTNDLWHFNITAESWVQKISDGNVPIGRSNP